MSALEAAVARARQAFGLDPFSDAADPAGMEFVRQFVLEHYEAGARAIAIRIRPWAANERPAAGEPWAVDLLLDHEVMLTIRYRIGICQPVERDFPIRLRLRIGSPTFPANGSAGG